MIRMTWPQYVRHEASVEGRVVCFTPLETEVLSTLLVRYPCPVPMNDIIEAVYPDPDREPEYAASVVAIMVRHIRRKIGRDRIEAGNGLGYRLWQRVGEIPSPPSKAQDAVALPSRDFDLDALRGAVGDIHHALALIDAALARIGPHPAGNLET